MSIRSMTCRELASNVNAVTTMLYRHARFNPEAPALRLYSETGYLVDQRTYGDLYERSYQIAQMLLETGTPSQSSILVVVAEELEFVEAIFGCMLGGFVAIPVWPEDLTDGDQAMRMYRRCRPAATLATQNGRKRLGALADTAPIMELPLKNDADQIGYHTGYHALIHFAIGVKETFNGVVLSHRTLVENFCLRAQRLGYQFIDEAEPTKLGCAMPFKRSSAVLGTIFDSIFLGTGCEWFASPLASPTSPTWSSKQLAKEYKRERLSGFVPGGNVPSVVGFYSLNGQVLTPSVGGDDLPVRTVYSLCDGLLCMAGTANFVAGETLQLAHSFFQQGLVRRAEDGDDAVEAVNCGKPLEEHVIQVVDPAYRHVVGPNRIGELWFSGPSMPDGFMRKNGLVRAYGERTVEGFGPFFRTGDWGFQNEAGEVFVAEHRGLSAV